MCLALFKPAKQTIPRQLLKNAFEQNDDGAGFAFAHKEKLIVHKGFFTFDEFWKEFDKIQKGNPAIAHFRLASVGDKSKNNCHPFFINDDLAVVHNGTLQDFIPSKKNTKSDTAYFVDTILKPMFERVPDAHKDFTFQYALEKMIGAGNKMIFLDSKGRHSIIRDFAGEWENKCWYSNDSYKVKEKPEWMKGPKHYTDIDLLSEEEWKAIKNEQMKITKKYKPRNQTEQLLGGPSQLGNVSKQKIHPAYMKACGDVARRFQELDGRDVRTMMQ